MENKFQIFCDMDGVLTDFNRRFVEISGNKDRLNPADYIKKYSKEEFWALIVNEGQKWWSEMDWKDDGKKLWNFISAYKPVILSAPSRDPNSLYGKLEWLRNNIPELHDDTFNTVTRKKQWNNQSRVILNSSKYGFCRHSNSILIDDTLKHIEEWRKAGGIAIHHINTQQTISELEKILKLV